MEIIHQQKEKWLLIIKILFLLGFIPFWLWILVAGVWSQMHLLVLITTVAGLVTIFGMKRKISKWFWVTILFGIAFYAFMQAVWGEGLEEWVRWVFIGHLILVLFVAATYKIINIYLRVIKK